MKDVCNIFERFLFLKYLYTKTILFLILCLFCWASPELHAASEKAPVKREEASLKEIKPVLRVLKGTLLNTSSKPSSSPMKRRTFLLKKKNFTPAFSPWFDLDLFLGLGHHFGQSRWFFFPKIHAGFAMYSQGLFDTKVFSVGAFGEFPNFSEWSVGGYLGYLSTRSGINLSIAVGTSSLGTLTARLIAGVSLFSVEGQMYNSGTKTDWAVLGQIRIPISLLLHVLTRPKRQRFRMPGNIPGANPGAAVGRTLHAPSTF